MGFNARCQRGRPRVNRRTVSLAQIIHWESPFAAITVTEVNPVTRAWDLEYIYSQVQRVGPVEQKSRLQPYATVTTRATDRSTGNTADSKCRQATAHAGRS